MKILKYKELEKLRKENPKKADKVIFKAGIVSVAVALIVVALAPVVEENVLFVSLTTAFIVFASMLNVGMQDKTEGLNDAKEE
ncbi:hypothetical protein [Sulfurimonas sp.]|uniref:hypothetical protein n=1 Tax=Sulfurimonas sp. TaxID=2022749 RepID=UPI0025E31F5F|nr:hypothetical protein [Sulfurimonas sp.]MBW6487560.1 hypothetical protein [Sulfurimonas sp.]